MTEKDKIIEIILNTDVTERAADRIADDLIENGIGDVSEWEHRAEVAERALEYAVSEYRCDECPNIECNAEIRGSLECIELICAEYKKQAERDIAEEKQISIDEYLERLNEK